jgi:hypothetical protein
MNGATILSTFRISEVDLEHDQTVSAAYDEYSARRYAFGEALKELRSAVKVLHQELDGPLRSAGLIPEGKDWTFKECVYDGGIFIQVLSEPRRRGRRKPEVPLKQLALGSSQVKMIKLT